VLKGMKVVEDSIVVRVRAAAKTVPLQLREGDGDS
jgi:hypothetical protein